MSLLGFFNYYIFQWFFVRLGRCEWDVKSVVNEKEITLIRYKFLTGVYPLSGWDGNPYKYIDKSKK